MSALTRLAPPTIAACSTSSPPRTAILKYTRSENFSKWYAQVTKVAQLAEWSSVPGCMVIKPWGLGIWKQIQKQMDELFEQNNCCEHYQFPLMIPVSLMAKEATHIDGFSSESAVVTNHRVISDGKGGMIPDPEAALKDPLIIRPTSEIIIGESFRKWIRSVSDLPLTVNQWANVVRWEGSRTTLFLRTIEFFWQEGHCAFATQGEALDNAMRMTRFYETFMTNVCALPIIAGEKSPRERFAGAVQTFCLEALMQDGKAVQAGTSHYLGENFAKASGVRFQDRDNTFKSPHTTSWGVSTRLIGALIMTHGDDDGLRVPPRLAMHQVVIIPQGEPSEERNDYIEKIKLIFKRQFFFGDQPISLIVDARDRKRISPAEKNYEWIAKGIPLRLEVGKFEVRSGKIPVRRRDRHHVEKTCVHLENLVEHVVKTLEEIQSNYYNQALTFRNNHIRTDIKTLDEIKAFFADRSNMGFVRANWFVDKDTEYMLKEDYGVTIRCIPFEQNNVMGTCVLTGRPTATEAIFGRSY